MNIRTPFKSLGTPLVFLALLMALVAAQSQPVAANHAAPAPTPTISDKDVVATQEQLIKLLRLSPTLTTVVARDPTLLANQDYVNRSNPQLAQFLVAHPEVARNPEFYLFSHMDPDDHRPDQALERAVWPDLVQPPHQAPLFADFLSELTPLLTFIVCLGAMLWLVRAFLENKRWGRIFKLQMDVHGRLIDKFGTSQEVLTYMETEAGRRFLEAAPIPVDFERQQPISGAAARILTPLQIGVVLTLLGLGFLFLRHAFGRAGDPMLILGVIILMPGLGFIISAGITWLLAGRLGLMPHSNGAGNSLHPLFDPRERP